MQLFLKEAVYTYKPLHHAKKLPAYYPKNFIQE